jgi:hypothetical protein
MRNGSAAHNTIYEYNTSRNMTPETGVAKHRC